MNRNSYLLILATLLFLLSGCAINQRITPTHDLGSKEICLIEDPSVRAGFLATYRTTLQEKGYRVKLLPKGSNYDHCPVVSTYLGKWSWDLGLYLAYAEIKVYRDGRLVGDALYDSTMGGANMSKFIKGDEKIREMVSQLYPNAI